MILQGVVEMSKNSVRFNLLLVMLVLVIVSVSVNVFANNEIYEMKGYSEDVVDFTVSSIVDTFDATDIDSAFDAGLVAESPVEVVLKNEIGSSFNAYKLKEINEKTYGYNPDDQLEIQGKVLVTVPIEGAVKNPYGQYSNDDIEELTIDINDLDDYEYIDMTVLPGAKIEIKEPGDYYVMFRIRATMGATEAFIKVIDPEKNNDDFDNKNEVLPDETIEAVPSNTKIIINGLEVVFDSYNINGNNYFKLRDLAYSLRGSNKQFGIMWDNESRSIKINTGNNYTSVGGEMSKDNQAIERGIINKDSVYVDNEIVDFLAYNIKGNNYFKLRDVAQGINFAVLWDANTKTIRINTNSEYVE